MDTKHPLFVLRTALGFHYASALMPLVCLGLYAAGMAALLAVLTTEPDSLSSSDAEAFALLAAVALAAFVATAALTSLLGTAGAFLCLAAPPESRCAEIAVAGLLLHVIGLLAAALLSLGLVTPALWAWGDVIKCVQVGAFVLEKGLFLLFMYRLGAYLDRRDVRRRAWSAPLTLLVALAVLGGGIGLGWWRWPEGGAREAPALLVAALIALGLVGLVLLLLAYSRYLGLLRRGRRACAEVA
jgi:hypothetical protein